MQSGAKRGLWKSVERQKVLYCINSNKARMRTQNVLKNFPITRMHAFSTQYTFSQRIKRGNKWEVGDVKTSFG